MEGAAPAPGDTRAAPPDGPADRGGGRRDARRGRVRRRAGGSGGSVKEGGVFRLGSNSSIDSLNPFVAFQA